MVRGYAKKAKDSKPLYLKVGKDASLETSNGKPQCGSYTADHIVECQMISHIFSDKSPIPEGITPPQWEQVGQLLAQDETNAGFKKLGEAAGDLANLQLVDSKVNGLKGAIMPLVSSRILVYSLSNSVLILM